MTSSSRARTARRSAIAFALVLDGLGWIVAVAGGALIDNGGAAGLGGWALAATAALAAGLQLGMGSLLGLYGGRHIPGSFQELQALFVTILIIGVLLGIPVAVFGETLGLPRTLMIIASALALIILGTVRLVRRIKLEQTAGPTATAEPALIYGAGYLGRHLIRRMRTDPESQYRAVGIIDDDPANRKLTIDGVRVLGPIDNLPSMVEATDARVLVVSIARADAALMRRVFDLGEAEGLRVLVFPSLEEVLEGKSRLGDLRDVGIEDVIGRHPIETDVESMAGYLKGKRLLVTGAGGSIGAELCRQIAKYGPERLVMLDRDETGLQGTQLLLDGNGLLANEGLILADIRDADEIRRIFEEHRPEVVFHAAALKHLSLLERHPDEAWKTNVEGTLNVLQAALAVDVETFVNISTDKAANPSSILGRSKRIAEGLTAWAAEQSSRRYLSVRFGNVLGSRGSLVPVFAALIEAGGPVTVTHEDATRYFMSIPEACHLVVQAGGIGNPGEVLILDMGEPVRIMDVAERMISLSGRDIAIVFTGLRPGEKLHEELVGADELIERPVHPKIAHTHAEVVPPAQASLKAWHEHQAVSP